MNLTIAAFLTQDGLITGAIYALMAVAIVLVFTVTRVIFVPQGDFVAFSALTMAAFHAGRIPGTAWLLLLMAALAAGMEAWGCLRRGDARGGLRGIAVYGLAPALLAAVVVWAAQAQLPLMAQAALTLAVVIAIGPLLYRVAYQPVAQATVLVLLIISVAVHLA